MFIRIKYIVTVPILWALFSSCNLFEIPVPRLVDQFIRLGETSELADWLRNFERPGAAFPRIFPVLPGMALPLTTGQLQDVTAGTLVANSAVLCHKSLCAGEISGYSINDSGLQTYHIGGTWTSFGEVLSASGGSRWAGGIRASWHFADGLLKGYWAFEQPLKVTRITITYQGTLTTAAANVPVGKLQMRDLYRHVVAEGSPWAITRSETPITTVAWPTPVSSLVTPEKSMVFYPDKTTSYYRQWEAGLPLWSETLFFGAHSVTGTDSKGKFSKKTYPPGEAYFSVEDRLSMTEPRVISREIRTYDGRYHLLSGTVENTAPGRRLLQVHLKIENYVGDGFLQYQTDSFGLFARWEGAIDEADGSTLSFLMYRGPLGFWRLSTSYDFAPTEAFPDEELEMQYASDGSGWGTGVLIHTVNDKVGSGNFVDRFAASLAQPQPGARLSSR